MNLPSPEASVIAPVLSTGPDFTKLETSISTPFLPSAPDNPFPSSRSETTTILSLPTEILLRVTYLLTLPPQPQPHPATSSETPATSNFNHSYTRTLKRFRLTHPAFSYLPLPHLFSHVILPLSGKHGLLRLHSISSYEHLARHVQHLKIYVKFDLKEPDIGFFGQAKAGGSIYWQDLFGVRELPPRRRSQWRSNLQRRASDFSSKLGGKGKGKGKGREREGSQSQPKDASGAPVDAMDATRSASVVSADADDTIQDLQSQPLLDRTRTFPDPTTAPEDFLRTFDDLTALTITRTLLSSPDTASPTTVPSTMLASNSESKCPSSSSPPLSPILQSLASFLTTIFTSLPRLQTLCIDSSTQEEFMENLDRRWALRFAPLQDIWERVSSCLVAGIVAGWVNSDCTHVRRLWVLGGAVGWGDRLIDEYLTNPAERSELPNETDYRGWQQWRDKAARMESLSLKFDVGAYRKNFDAVESTWLPMVHDLLTAMPALRYLEIGKQRRADGCVSDRNGGRAVRLSNIVIAGAAEEGDDQAERLRNGTTRMNLRLLRLSDVSVASPSDLKSCIEALGGEGLERLMLGSVDLYDGTWVTVWNMLRNECKFKLKQFLMMGTRYSDVRGNWNVDKRAYESAYADGQDSGMGDSTWEVKRLIQLSEYVEGKGDEESFRDLFPVVEDVGVPAVTKWMRNGDDSLRYSTR